MIKTYTYKIKTTRALENKIESWYNICRFVYNCAKELKEESYRKGISLSKFDIIKQLPDAKKELPWIAQVHSQTLQQVIGRLDNSFKKFYSGAGYPKWAKKDKWKSITFAQDDRRVRLLALRFEKDGRFNLPKLGKIKVFNRREIQGKIKLARVVKEADGYYLKIVVEENDRHRVRENQSICAIDMGITYFMTTSDGEFIENPKHLFNYLKQLKVENRKLSRMKKGGSNFKKQVKVIQLLHQKISRVRKDFLHKESRKLANNYKTVIRENLNILKMVKGSKLAKHILDCSWGTFFQMLDYKTNVIKVNPAYTSQECSKCGHICKENRKIQSLFECINCGYTENADLQATFNILQRGQYLMEANVE